MAALARPSCCFILRRLSNNEIKGLGRMKNPLESLSGTILMGLIILVVMVVVVEAIGNGGAM